MALQDRHWHLMLHSRPHHMESPDPCKTKDPRQPLALLRPVHHHSSHHPLRLVHPEHPLNRHFGRLGHPGDLRHHYRDQRPLHQAPPQLQCCQVSQVEWLRTQGSSQEWER